MSSQRLGYIQENKDSNERFRFMEAPFTRRISSKSDKVSCKLFYGSFDYGEIAGNADMMKKNPGIILVGEPFLLDEELKEKAVSWVSRANKSNESERDPLCREEP